MRRIVKYDISKQLTALLEKRGMTIGRLSSRTRISQRNLRAYCNVSKPETATRRQIQKIAFVLNITPLELLGFDPGFDESASQTERVIDFHQLSPEEKKRRFERTLRIIGIDYLTKESDFCLYASRDRDYPVKNELNRWVL